MRRSLTVVMMVFASLVLSMGSSPAVAADSPIGTWAKKGEAGKPGITLTIEEWGPGKAKLTWRMSASKMVMTLTSALDGSEAPLLIDGKPSGETMAVKLVDKHHAITTAKMQGKPFGTSKATYSADFKTLTIENDFAGSVGGNPAGKSTETWIRQ